MQNRDGRFSNAWFNDIAFADIDSDENHALMAEDRDISSTLERIPDFFLVTAHNEDDEEEEEEDDEEKDTDHYNVDEEEEREQTTVHSIFSDDNWRASSEKVRTAKEVEMESQRHRDNVSLQVRRAKLDILRATITLQRDTALNFVITRIRSMHEYVLNWVYHVYAQAGRTLNNPTYNKETFQKLICSAYSSMEEMKPGIIWYCTYHNDHYLFATVVSALATEAYADSERNMAKVVLSTNHHSADDAMGTVAPTQYHEYWNSFLRALLNEMCAAIYNRIDTESNRSSESGPAHPKALVYVEKIFSAIIDRFFCECILQKGSDLSFSSIDHHEILNESTRQLTAPFKKTTNDKSSGSFITDVLATR